MNLRATLFELLAGDRQDLVREVAKVPDVIEALKDTLDEGFRLGVVGSHEPEYPRRVPRRGVGAQAPEGFIDFALAEIPLRESRTRLRFVSPDQGYPSAGCHPQRGTRDSGLLKSLQGEF
jgi:hypothetical protein